MGEPKTSAVRVVRCDSGQLTGSDNSRIESFISRYMLYDRKRLDAALEQATYIWLCLDRVGRIVGTTAVRRIELPAAVGKHRRPPVVTYTSVVAINPAYRRLGLPARMGMKTYLYERWRAPLNPLYWVAEAVSPAGYLQLARNLKVFWPQPGAVMPPRARAVLEATLAAARVGRFDRIGDAYLVFEDFGIIEREQSPDRWKRTDADVDYFLRINPDYWTGVAVVCLAPLNVFAVGKAVGSRALKILLRRRASRT